jgi:hypothetical protein
VTTDIDPYLRPPTQKLASITRQNERYIEQEGIYRIKRITLLEGSMLIQTYICQNEQKQDACLHCSTVRTPLYIDVADHLPAS